MLSSCSMMFRMAGVEVWPHRSCMAQSALHGESGLGQVQGLTSTASPCTAHARAKQAVIPSAWAPMLPGWFRP